MKWLARWSSIILPFDVLGELTRRQATFIAGGLRAVESVYGNGTDKPAARLKPEGNGIPEPMEILSRRVLAGRSRRNNKYLKRSVAASMRRA